MSPLRHLPPFREHESCICTTTSMSLLSCYRHRPRELRGYEEMGMLKSIRVAAALALLAAPALAQPKTLTVAAYRGVWDSHLRKEVFPEFENKYGAEVHQRAPRTTAK